MNLLLNTIKQSKHYNPSEFKIICQRFSGTDLALKIIDTYDIIFNKECSEMLKNRGLR